MSKKESIIISIAIVVIFALCAGLYFMFLKSKRSEKEMTEIVEQLNYEKEALEQEYSDLSLFEGLDYKLQNDSILKLLDTEKQRVQLLLEELRLTKATNARRISELKKELASVRKVMVYYVSQIDSLNTLNKTLKSENREIRNKYDVATQTVQSLSQEKDHLTQQVKLASMLEARDIVVTTLNDREKKITKLRKIALIRFDFVILKNITAPTGLKTIYLRITTPDERVLMKNQDQVFDFEGSTVAYSCKKQTEYAGEELSEKLYWKVEELLLAGTYRVDIFLDGNLIGSRNFVLK